MTPSSSLDDGDALSSMLSTVGSMLNDGKELSTFVGVLIVVGGLLLGITLG
jgi:hypothetical protein